MRVADATEAVVEHHLHDPEQHEPIPGERDLDNLTHRQPGAMGGHFTGAETPSADPRSLMDDVTLSEHEKEGGGALGDRRDADREKA